VYINKKYTYQAVKQKEQLKIKRQDYNKKQGDTNDRTTWTEQNDTI